MSAESQEFANWIGRTDTPPADIVTQRIVDGFRATIAPVISEGLEIPLGLHWCLNVPSVEEVGLGQDGHPAKGGFLPPIPLPRRMWAGGEVEFLDTLSAGDTVEKSSEIIGVVQKNGRSGSLYFVSVAHSYSVDQNVVIRERQDIVYRAAAREMLSLPPPNLARPEYVYDIELDVTSVTLFRYSALTFNAHRIHYDQPYAQDREYYPDLVIHGPLQATALMNFAATLKGESPRHFAYRGVAPAIGPQKLTLGANEIEDGACALSILNEAGHPTMEATSKW